MTNNNKTQTSNRTIFVREDDLHKVVDKLTEKVIASNLGVTAEDTQMMYFHKLTTMDDFSMIMLVAMGLLVDELMEYTNELKADKKICRLKIKEACNMLHNPNGNSCRVDAKSIGLVFKGWADRIEYYFLSNLNRKDWVRYSNIKRDMRGIIALDILKMKNVCSLEVGNSKIKLKHPNVTAKVLNMLLFAHVIRNVMMNINEKANGNQIALCLDSTNADCRKRAYIFSVDDVDNIISWIERIAEVLCVESKYMLPYTNMIIACIRSIFEKLVDISNIYSVAIANGLDLRKTSSKLSDRFTAYIDALCEGEVERGVTIDDYEADVAARQFEAQMMDTFTDKGWIKKY